MKKLILMLVLAATAVSFTACNTMKGAGKDVERGGEKLQDASGK
jgi:entericidin B